MSIEGLDKLDNAILDSIRENARMSYSDIGEKVGLSRVAVKNRMDAMEKKGIIKGYKTVIDETKITEGISFVLDVEIIPEEYENVVEALAKDRFLRQIYNTTGDCRLHCTGFAPNHTTLAAHLNHLYVKTKGILVVGVGEFTGADGQEHSPAKDILKSGDYILKLNSSF